MSSQRNTQSDPSEQDTQPKPISTQKIVVKRRSSSVAVVALGVLIAILLAIVILGIIGLNHLTALNQTTSGISAKVSTGLGTLSRIEYQISRLTAVVQAGLAQVGAELSKITAALHSIGRAK